MATAGRRAQASLEAPAVLLIEPQLPENIGATARAMMNCGLVNLRLVRPREAWPNARSSTPPSWNGGFITMAVG